MVYELTQTTTKRSGDEEKPIEIIRWIHETSIYPSGKVVCKVFPTRGMAKAYAKKKDVGEQETFKPKITATEDL